MRADPNYGASGQVQFYLGARDSDGDFVNSQLVTLNLSSSGASIPPVLLHEANLPGGSLTMRPLPGLRLQAILSRAAAAFPAPGT